MQGSQEHPLKNIPLVTISGQGIFKYILISCQAISNSQQIQIPEYLVRGDKVLEYHQQNFEKFIREIKSAGFEIKKKNLGQGHFQASKGGLVLKFTCRGGGRIEHNYGNNKCFIYGYSQSYGNVDHEIAQKLISVALNYPLNQITTSQDGY